MAGHDTLPAIPFFILASSFMSTGGAARRIIRFASALVGHLPGGLAIAGVFACMLFAALSGSSLATVVAIGFIVIAGMREVGYTKDFAAGVIANPGILGSLIAPSIVMVVYASATDISEGRMFLAGVGSGLMAGTMLMVTICVMAIQRDLPQGEWRDRGLFYNCHPPWRHRRRHLYADRSGGAGGGLCLIDRLFPPARHGAVACRGVGVENLSLLRKPLALVTAVFHRDTKKTRRLRPTS